jgi:hypothetical protein
MRCRSPAGVSPVRTHVRISTSPRSCSRSAARMSESGASRFVWMSFERLQRGDVDDLGLVPQRSVKSLPHQIVDRRHERGQGLPGTGWRGNQHIAPGLDGGHARVCAAVGAWKLCSNQATTAAWNNEGGLIYRNARAQLAPARSENAARANHDFATASRHVGIE